RRAARHLCDGRRSGRRRDRHSPDHGAWRAGVKAYTAGEYRDRLFKLLPALYRTRDTERELYQFLAVFARPMARAQADALQLWNNFSIESCEDWVVPYLADLVGASLVFEDPALARAEVRSAVRWTKTKGT